MNLESANSNPQLRHSNVVIRHRPAPHDATGRLDFVRASPPFNDSDRFCEEDAMRWQFSIQPKGGYNPRTRIAQSTERITRMIPPGMNSSLPPRFYELGYVKFQALCADLLARDARYSDSQEYGCSGQAQRGIDVLAILAVGSGVEVGQCKCWEGETTAAKVHEASDEFLPHLDHWKQQGLKRFILFAACPTDDTKVQDQILVEAKRFKDHGIVYEFWDARKLHRVLRP